MDWPVYCISYTRGDEADKSPFEIEGKAKYHYVDFPNQLVKNFCDYILIKIESSYPPEKQYKEAMELKEEYNERIEGAGYDFLKLVLVQRQTAGDRPYFGIQVRIDEDRFRKFLEEFSESDDIKLEEKYWYLFNSRFSSLVVESKSERSSTRAIETIQEDVNDLVEDEIKDVDEEIDRLISNVENWQDRLQSHWRNRIIWRNLGIFPSTLLYLMEIGSILQDIRSLANQGSIPPCYREMRKLLENLTWAIFDDFLLLNSDYYEYFKDNPDEEVILPIPFSEVNKEWYNWTPGEREKSRDFDKGIRKLRNSIFEHCQKSRLKYDEKHGIRKGEIKVELKKKMSYPLYIALSGIETNEKKDVEEFVHPCEFDDLKPLIKMTLENVLKGLKEGGRLGKLDRDFLGKTVESLLGDGTDYIVPPFPSNTYVINYVDDIWHKDLKGKLNDFYSQYSIFVHSYPYSWQVYPFSSVLEFKILRHEMKKFSSTISSLMESYFENCH